MKIIILSACTLVLFQITSAQGKYLTNEGRITFFSHTLIEDISATNEKVAAIIDGESGEVAIIVVMNEFQFEKKLMQEHFNENYVESEKYPKATFIGHISDNSGVDYQAPGEYQVLVKGKMSIHGITREISSEGIIGVQRKGLTVRAKFQLNPEDYGIKIPGVLRKNIAEHLEITVAFLCHPI